MDDTSVEIPVVKALRMPQYENPEEHHKEIMRRRKMCQEAWQDVFQDYVADSWFADGRQWDEKVLRYREEMKLTSLTYNQIPAKRRFIVNNARMNDTAIKCIPVNGGADKNTAKVLDGIIKYCQHKYNAKASYINALDNVVVGGIGAWKILPIKAGDDYDIEIIRITDPTSVMMDPNAKKQDFSDAEYCFVTQLLAKSAFKTLYPDAQSADPERKGGFNEDSVEVFEYWIRNQDSGYCEQYICTESEILESNTEYKGKHIPIVFVTGEESHIEGQRRYKGIVRDIKDIQMLLNLTKSRTADYIQRSSNEEWLVTSGQIADHLDRWNQSNVNGSGVKIYTHTEGVPAPKRLDAPAPPVGYMQVAAEADADLRAAIGIRDPLAELPDNVATETMQMHVNQGNIGTYAYTDKINDARDLTGKIFIDLIPHYFNYAHVREIMGDDGEVSTIPLNQPYEENGETVMHDLSKGSYAVLVKSGPSYESRRAEALGKLLEIAKYDKEFFIKYADILYRNMDFDGAEDMASRARAGIPPAILAASGPTNGDTAGNDKAMAAQLQQQLQQMQQVIQQLQQEKAADIAKIQEQGKLDLTKLQLENAHQKEMEQIKTGGKDANIQTKGSVDASLESLRSQGRDQNIQTKGAVDVGLIDKQSQEDAKLTMLDGQIDTFHLGLDHDHQTTQTERRELSPRSI